MKRSNGSALIACVVGLGCVAFAPPAWADRLDEIESSHQPPPQQPQPQGQRPPPGRGSGSRSRDASGRSEEAGFLGRLTSIFLSAFWPAVTSDDGIDVSDAPHPAIEPYDGRSIYVAPEERSRRIVRYAELGIDGNLSPTPGIYGHGLHLRGFLGPFVVHGEWTRLHEPDAESLRSLDFFRGHLGANIFIGTRWAELYVLAGALGMRGNEWTPAFDFGLESRVYPARPITLYVSGMASIFEHGSPLFTARFEPGVSVSRIDLRLGATAIYQSRVIAAVGPSGSVALRW